MICCLHFSTAASDDQDAVPNITLHKEAGKSIPIVSCNQCLPSTTDVLIEHHIGNECIRMFNTTHQNSSIPKNNYEVYGNYTCLYERMNGIPIRSKSTLHKPHGK